ncbi:MAG: fumarylacetoacetate hydrolase family protein [Betaproteobacteria bacterium]|nr:fumarylacetoacetate hydrolase family protein [Betaproteobacteria bacterium]
MKLVTYQVGKGAPKVGVVLEDRIAPLAAPDMISLIEKGRKAIKVSNRKTIALSSVKLLAPIPRPRKNVFCVGWNYLEHFEEGAKARAPGVELPAHPTYFTKQPLAVTGPYSVVPSHPDVTQKLDWEVELGVIIGKGGRNITEANAMKHVFGYTVINDVSAREIQRQHGQQWFKGKSLDGHCPMGPWIVTADELKDPTNLEVQTRVNGVVKQNSNTKHMYFKIPRIIASLSAGLTLEPGDIISTGTPAGVGHARTPPEFMKKGDLLETEITGIGLLRNRIG